MKPKYEHDCNLCTFLGRVDDHDLYVHYHTGFHVDDHILYVARYGHSSDNVVSMSRDNLLTKSPTTDVYVPILTHAHELATKGNNK